MGLRVWAALALAACSGEGPGGGDASCDAQISAVIGTGANAYEPLVDGSPVTMVHGPQGGWHIETSAIVSASEQEVSVVPRVVVPALGGLQIAGEQPPQFIALAAYDEPGCSGEFWGVRAYIDEPDPPPDEMAPQQFICSLEGQTLELTVTVTELSSQEATESTVSVVAELDPADVAPCGDS